MKLAWYTDIHLDCVGNVQNKLFNLCELMDSVESVLITGDISIASQLIPHLSMIENAFQRPIYFVLGNHDYYGSDISSTRRSVVNACNSSSYLKYMISTPYMQLSPGVMLIGHDAWYDAFNGNPNNNQFMMNDWIRIADFNSALKASSAGTSLNKNAVIEIARRLAHQATVHVVNGIKSAVKQSSHIIIMTHVPPFKESYNSSEKHKGLSSQDVIPWYTSRMMGDAIFAAAKAYPNVKFTVLSGHLHSHYEQELLNNLTVRVGKSVYGSPQLAGFIEI